MPDISPTIVRPYPPTDLDFDGNDFRRAREVEEWILNTFLNEASPLYNDEHDHLGQANIGVLWATEAVSHQGLSIAGMAEIPMLKGKGWIRSRQEYQLMQWFDGAIPHFVITLSAPYAMDADDVHWCSLVEHELYHCAQAVDGFGMPRFNKETGLPIFTMRGHDVEEFVGIVRRYGARAGAGRTAELVAAAMREPEVAAVDVAHVCGTCLRVAA